MKIICPHCLGINNVPHKESYLKVNCGKCKKSLLEPHPANLSSDDIDRVLSRSDIPVIVDFWAPWCGPCKMMSPVFKEVSGEFALKVLFAKINTQDEQFLASRFKIRSIPTLIVFKNGKEIKRISGALDAETLREFVSKFV
ncbi:MAG: thioredoxin TrxC [Sulfurospirillaceae bacterium]|nr:thioredoxin TrxC [Sulfurospirillaceae bacterium]